MYFLSNIWLLFILFLIYNPTTSPVPTPQFTPATVGPLYSNSSSVSQKVSSGWCECAKPLYSLIGENTRGLKTKAGNEP